jgi:hypothetical protein
MDKILTGGFKLMVTLNPIIHLTNFLSFLRKNTTYLQSSYPVDADSPYSTVWGRFAKLVDKKVMSDDLPGFKYILEFMNLSYNLGAYALVGADFLNHGFFQDIYRKKRGFKEYFQAPTEIKLWIAVRNSFAYWLKKAETRFGTKSIDYKFIAFFERVANEGLRRALLDPDFNSDDIVGGRLVPTADYWMSAFKRVMQHQPLFTRDEWESIPMKYKNMFSEDLIRIMDLQWQEDKEEEKLHAAEKI